MRILTPIEQREIERLKNLILADKIDRIEFQAAFGASEDRIFHLPEERELWLNLLDMVLETNAALGMAWRLSSNPKTDIVELVRSALSE